MPSSLTTLATASLLSLILLLTLAGSVAAAEYRASDRVDIDTEETVEDDLYVAAGQTVIDGRVNGDLTVASGTVEVRGTVAGSLNSTGGNVTVSGSVARSGRVSRMCQFGSLPARPDCPFTTSRSFVAASECHTPCGGISWRQL